MKQLRKLPKLTPKKLRGMAADQLFYFLGCCCYAAAINIFVVPNQIAHSGISGLAIMVNHFFPSITIGMTNLALNLPLVILALIFIGWRFVSKTLWVIVELSVIIDLMPRVVNFSYADDRLLATLFAGALGGFGLALVIIRGATSGGTDIVGWLVRKRLPHISLGRVILVADGAVVLAGAIAFRDLNAALYAAIMIFVSTRIIDTMIYGSNNGKMFYIFTAKAEELAQAVIKEIGRSATTLRGTGAFTGERKDILLCVVRRTEITRLRQLVKETDPQSFMVIAEAQEVFGLGFRDHE